MNYFDLYSSYPDHTIAAAWDSQLAEASQTPGLAEILLPRGSELFPRFAACYAELRTLPRSARRALQRQLARSHSLAETFPECLQRGTTRALQRKLAWSLAGAALLLGLGQGVATAATITVTTNVTRINADEKCSLIEAIVNANDDAATHSDCPAGSGADVIVLPKGIHRLTDVDNSAYGATGLPVITSPITIQGNGTKIVRRGGPPFRLMVVSNSGDLTLQGVTLSGGYAFNDFGGGIYNNGGTVNVQNSFISKNRATGFYSYSYGTYYGGHGGSVFNNNGTVTIENSTISSNKAEYGGGGVSNSGGTVSIKNSTISGNTAVGGGGISSGYGGSLFVDASTVSKNKAGFGGGVFNYSSGTITNSSITGNKAILAFGLGGGLSNNGDLSIENSTVSKNQAYVGGGVFNRSFLTFQNSTVSGNKASSTGGGIVNFTAFGNADLTITNSTISGNKAYYAGGLHNSSFSYYGYAYSNVTLNRSLISGNHATYAPEIGNYHVLTADNFNLFGANGNAGVTGFVPGLTDVVPAHGVTLAKILDRLRSNGGPTQTHALKPGSPALDVIPFTDPGCTGTDQRGVTRPQGTGCDIGAFELDGP